LSIDVDSKGDEKLANVHVPPTCCPLESKPRHTLLDIYLGSCINKELDNPCVSFATGTNERVATVNVDICPSIQQLTNHGLVTLEYRGGKG
jgi:hypothetical protein